jgi:nitrate reductase delta subunit
MLGAAKKRPDRLQVLDRVQEWTRERFGLARDAQIHVWEIACTVPGCPPVETAVVFWIADQRHQFKVFKPVDEIVCGDLPPAWLRKALAVADGFEYDCC